MQSIHNLAQHRPIISMEEFMAQVAWPRVQHSPVGEGEAPTAQESQPEPEATQEDTPEETPEATPAATPIEAIEEGDGTIDADYVADMAAAQSTWDPRPTPTQDTSLPAQDAPFSPHDDPTLTQDDWRQDLIYIFAF